MSRRKSKKYYIILILLLLLGVTFGYAVLNSTLNINGKSTVQKNTWDVHFENIQVKEGSVTATVDPVISNNTSISNFEITLDKPGDFYEFTVDVVNDGSIDAMIDSVTKTHDLTTAQQKYLNYVIEYQNKEQITTKQLVKASEFVRLKVRVEYKKDITASDLPQNIETLNLGFTVNYVQSDGSGSSVKDNGVFEITANGSLDEIGTIVTIGEQQFYTIGTEGDNVKLLSMYNLYVGNSVDSDLSVTPLASPTGKQSELAKGWLDGATEWHGTTAFSSDTQKGTNYSDYSGSIVEGYVNNYKNILESEYGVDVVEARLITKDELTSEEIGCSVTDYTCTGSAYPWIYSTSYWSGSASNARDVWNVDRFGNFCSYSYSHDGYFGVRPVIIISKSNF